MNELIIKRHDFEKAKKRLKEFSQKKSEDLNIDIVDTDGWFFGLCDHKVTGDELNSRLRTIQKHLIDLNSTNNDTIKEFGQVYNTFDVLDKGYIQAILTSIKATEKTSESIQATQEQIKKIVNDQKKTLEVLKKFKQKLDGYAHLGDIDKIWNDCQKWYNEITSLSNSIDSTMVISKANAQKAEDLEIVLNTSGKKINDLEKQLKQQIVKLESIISFTSELEKIVHLKDIDEMWNSIELHSSQLSELKKQSDETKSIVQTNKENTDAAIASVIEKNNTDIQMLTKKIKYAYILAGGSLGIAIIELIIILLKVI